MPPFSNVRTRAAEVILGTEKEELELESSSKGMETVKTAIV